MGDPSKLSRDAKGLVADFREELKLRDPWDREIDIQFKRIQRKYRDILFDFPFARQAHSVDQALWTDTSYALITQYRARIDPVRTSTPGNKNVVENRKILQKFLAFLGAEGTFWSGIVTRLVRIHGLTEANGAMAALGMNIVEFENRESLARHGQAEIPAPEEPPAPTHPPPSHEHRSNKLLVVFRALVYLGDIARYREQYGTHPNKGNSEPSAKRSRGGRRGKGGGAEKLNEKPFSKAEAFYIQARLLLPDYGNPFNQLAIVYSYQHDFFGAALNYYRALCVRKPFPTAQDNLVRTLAKCLEADREMWRERREQEANGEGDVGKGKGKAQPAGKSPIDNDASKDLEGRFKQDIVLLHALWAGKCRPAKLARHTQNVLASFGSLIARRLLPAATIVQVFVVTLGALWRVRMFRVEGDHSQERKRAKPKRNEREDEQDDDIPLETRIVAHLLALYTVLLEIGTREIQDGIVEAGEMEGDERQRLEKLAQRITGTFRRTLPALRIANKWVKANVRYLQQYSLEGGKEPNTPASPSLPNTMRPNLNKFWRAWSQFDAQLSDAFPMDLLPPITVDLEEDIDMRGFSPLKWGAGGRVDLGRGIPSENEAASVHPNEEQLMRIGDLIVDAKYITALPEYPLASGLPVQPAQSQSQGHTSMNPRFHERWEDEPDNDTDLGSDEEEDVPNQEDDRATVSTRTDDDPVQLAMNARLSDNEDEDEDEEQILYPQGYRQRPVSISMSPPPRSASPLPETGAPPAWPPPTPSFLSASPERSAPQFSQTAPSRPVGTTAEDLLNRVLNGTPTFLNMPTNSIGDDPSSMITSNTSFAGRTISMHGPTPSFLASSTQNRSFTSFSPPNPPTAPGLNAQQNFPRSPPRSSAFSNPRATSFSAVGSSGPSPPGRSNDPAASMFPSHTRLPSLTGAASIWTPAPQEVTRTPSWGTHSRTGPMRSNSIAGGMIPPTSVPGGVWPARNQGFGDMEVTRLPRQQTYATTSGSPRWG